MELAFLRKHTRAHKYLAHFSQAEINAVLEQYVPRLRSLQIFNSKIVPMEVKDEYHENVEKIVQEARELLNFQLRSKIKKKIGDPHVARVYSASFSESLRSFP
jgi:polynucleotide 5'-kinase involved in rRNA processing